MKAELQSCCANVSAVRTVIGGVFQIKSAMASDRMIHGPSTTLKGLIELGSYRPDFMLASRAFE